MRDNEFDQLLRDRLSAHPSEVPGEMWRRIQGESDDRRVFLSWKWYAVGAAALVAFLVGAHAIITLSRSITVPRVASVPANPSLHSLPPDRRRPTDLGACPASPPARPAAVLPAARPADSAAVALSIGPLSRRIAEAPLWPGRPSAFHPIHDKSGSARHSQTRSADSPTSFAFNPFPMSFAPDSMLLHPTTPLSIVSLSKRSAIYALAPLTPAVKCAQKPIPMSLKWNIDAFASPLWLASTTRYKLSYSIGARLTTNFKKHYTATTGLEYTAVISLTKYEHNGAVKYWAKQIDNLDLPILIGYTASNKEYSLGVNAGVLINLYSHEATPSYQLGRRATAAVLGLDFAKNLNDHSALFAAPYARYALKNNGQPLQDQTMAYGLLLGLRYKFMNR